MSCSLSISPKISPFNFREGAGCYLGLYSWQYVLHVNLENFIPANCLINLLRYVGFISRTPGEKIDQRDPSWPDFASHPERKTGRKGDETGKRAFPSVCLYLEATEEEQRLASALGVKGVAAAAVGRWSTTTSPVLRKLLLLKGQVLAQGPTSTCLTGCCLSRGSVILQFKVNSNSQTQVGQRQEDTSSLGSGGVGL